MDPNDLLALLAVARGRTHTAAAAALGCNHTTVARRIRTLEHDLGCRLLVATNVGWELTSDGRMALSAAEAVEAAMAKAPGPHGGPAVKELHGLVRVCSTELFGVAVVAPALARVHAEHPHISFELISITRPASAFGPSADLEIGVTKPSYRRLEVRRLADYELGLFASIDYLKSHRRPTTVAELAEHHPIYYVESMTLVSELNLLDRLFAQRRELLGATSVLAQLELTRAGAGIGLLPVYLAGRYPELERLLPEQANVLTYWLSGREENLRRPEVRVTAVAIEKQAHTTIVAPSASAE